jgi:spermidine synthase
VGKKPLFEILDCPETPIGVLILRRRELLGRPGTIVTEVTIDHELLMSSLNTDSERALADRALEWHAGAEEGLRVLVGGLGLGYTAAAALASPRVAHVEVVDRLPEVIGWLRRGLLPLSEQLNADERLLLSEGDVYARLLAPPAGAPFDLVLIDVDHSPQERLAPGSEPFYTAAGLARVREHLAEGGVLAVWSTDDDAPFRAALRTAFAEERHEQVEWVNQLIGDGQDIEDHLFLARR